MLEYCYLPRPEMGPGPWADEPDHVQFEYACLPCLAVRHPRHGYWCGYAGVPPGHPLHRLMWDSDEGRALLSDAPSHAGINYSAPCDPGGLVCHEAAPGEREPVWWFGMDFGHFFRDFAPAMALREVRQGCAPMVLTETYRDLAYVKNIVADLAGWLGQRRACFVESAHQRYPRVLSPGSGESVQTCSVKPSESNS